MLSNRQGKQLWIADETGGYVPVKKPADIHSRPRGGGLPDWWVVEKTPDWRPPPATFVEKRTPAKRPPEWVLVDGAPLPEQDGAGGPGMKIGAGGKPQGYDSHGRYTGPRGGAASLRNGSVSTFGTDGRMYANGEEAEEADGEEAPREDADAPQMTDMLLADGGKTSTDAGGGLFGGNEVRGPVTGPEVPEASATLTWKNDDPSKPDPRPEDLAPRMRDVVGSMRTDVPKLDDANVNSGTRKPRASHDPHAEGRAIDVNRINGISVRELKTSTAPGAERAREAAKNLEAWARNNPNVNQVIGPDGGWEFKGGEQREINKSDPRVDEHQHHYHINVFR